MEGLAKLNHIVPSTTTVLNPKLCSLLRYCSMSCCRGAGSLCPNRLMSKMAQRLSSLVLFHVVLQRCWVTLPQSVDVKDGAKVIELGTVPCRAAEVLGHSAPIG